MIAEWFSKRSDLWIQD